MALAEIPAHIPSVSSPLAQVNRSTNTSETASDRLRATLARPLDAGQRQALSVGVRQFWGLEPLYTTTFLPDLTEALTFAGSIPQVDKELGTETLLANLRRQSGLPVEVLAGALGVSRQTFYNWLYGEEPTSENELRIRTLATVLDDRLEGRAGREAKRYLLGKERGSQATRIDEISRLVVRREERARADLSDSDVNAESDSLSLGLSPADYGTPVKRSQGQ